MINGLDLFSGIGGISFALREWVRPVAYCEIDRYCQGVLLSRMVQGDLFNAPIWDDVKSLDLGESSAGLVDIIYGGFPCQDISVAGNGKGLAGERSGLFYEILRIAGRTQPRWIFLENVPALTIRGGTEVVREITKMGYNCRWCVISAASIGAVHRRERWFLLAHTNKNTNRGDIRNLSNPDEEKSESEEQYKEKAKQFNNGGQYVADPSSQGLEGHRNGASGSSAKKPMSAGSSSNVSDTRCKSKRSVEKPEWSYDQSTGCYRFWEVEPSMGRLADGISNRVDKLKGLGNSVVPQQVKEAFKILMGLK